MNRLTFAVLLCSPFCFSLAQAETKQVTVSLSAGPQDRQQTPVKVELTAAQILKDAKSVKVMVGQNGTSLPAQLCGPSLMASSKDVVQEVHFVVPEMKAGSTQTVQVILSTEAPETAGFQWHDTAGEFAELRWGEQPVMRYMYQALDESSPAKREETYKVFHHVFDPADGSRLITKGAGGQYTHHRGVFFGFNKVSYDEGRKKCDVWHCKPDAYLSHEGFLVSEAGLVLGRHRVRVDWHGPGKEVFAQEQRELTAYRVPGGVLLEFASRVDSKVGPVKLDGDPQHAGFHFRADNEVAAQTKGQTYYLRPDGQDKPGATRNWPGLKTHINLPWNVMSFVLGKQRYSTIYLDRPENPKESRFSERDYGRFGSYFEYEMNTDNPLVVNYRLWLQRGEVTGDQAALLSGNFTQPIGVVIAK